MGIYLVSSATMDNHVVRRLKAGVEEPPTVIVFEFLGRIEKVEEVVRFVETRRYIDRRETMRVDKNFSFTIA